MTWSLTAAVGLGQPAAVVAYAAQEMYVRVPTTQLTTYKLLVSQPTFSSAQTHNNGCSGLRTTQATGLYLFDT